MSSPIVLGETLGVVIRPWRREEGCDRPPRQVPPHPRALPVADA